MTNREMIINALETIINTRGEIRASGVPIDALPADYNRIIDAAWVALKKFQSK